MGVAHIVLGASHIFGRKRVISTSARAIGEPASLYPSSDLPVLFRVLKNHLLLLDGFESTLTNVLRIRRDLGLFDMLQDAEVLSRPGPITSLASAEGASRGDCGFAFLVA